MPNNFLRDSTGLDQKTSKKTNPKIIKQSLFSSHHHGMNSCHSLSVNHHHTSVGPLFHPDPGGCSGSPVTALTCGISLLLHSPPPPFFFEAPSFCCGAQALPSSPQKLLRNALQELGPRIQLFAGRNKDRSCPRELVTFVAGRKQHEGEIM